MLRLTFLIRMGFKPCWFRSRSADAAGRKDKQSYQVWQHGNHPIELYSEPVVLQKLDYIHQTTGHFV
jgi:hypothetical protein